MNDNSNDSVKNTERSELDVVIKHVKIQIRKHYAGYKEQIERIGNVLKENKVIKEEDICIETKNELHEEIKEKIISSDTIERCCPDKWKRKTKPKDPQSRFLEGKNSQEQGTVKNVNNNVTSEGQILQQKLEPDGDSKNIEEHKPEEFAKGLSKEVQQQKGAHIPKEQESVVELQQLKMEKKQQKEEIENLRDELNKLKAKGEVWTENKIINVLSLPQLELKITVNCAEKKIEDVEHNLFGLEKYYINNTSQQIENPPACDGVEEQQ